MIQLLNVNFQGDFIAPADGDNHDDTLQSQRSWFPRRERNRSLRLSGCRSLCSDNTIMIIPSLGTMMPMPAMMIRSSRMVLVSGSNRSLDGYDGDNDTSSTTVVSLLLSNTSDSSWNTDDETMFGIGTRIRQVWFDKWCFGDDDECWCLLEAD